MTSLQRESAAKRTAGWLSVGLLSLTAGTVGADIGDPQVATDHPWYPGELASSTFPRLQKTQAELYRRVVGVAPTTDEQKALAAWLWRNTHYWHGEEGALDLWGLGFGKGSDTRSREYWTGLFAHGFGLCGTTHSQWTTELDALLGPGRSRGVGVEGHNSLEVFLTGGPYGAGRWAMLDHDLSTVIYNPEGTALLGITDIGKDLKRLTDRSFLPKKQNGWLVCGLDPRDGAVYSKFEVAEYLPGYAGPPPMVHLRRGETLRRYLQPGLADGKTFVFWGRNYGTGGFPGPERSQTWVNQPDAMYGSTQGSGYHPGQARYANAVFTNRPDFRGGDYREGIVDEGPDHVTFEHQSPYVIGATPPNDGAWGVYDPGGKNGLVVRGTGGAEVSVSTDDGRTWTPCGRLNGALDLTDRVKGRFGYWLRIGAGASALGDSGLTLTTVCQANSSVLPRLKDGGATVRFEATHRAVFSAGPELERAKTHLVAGAFGSPAVTLQAEAPRGAEVVGAVAAAHVASGNPPSPEVAYQIEYSDDGGRSWAPVVKDWRIARRGVEPRDFWSQSLCYGAIDLAAPARKVQVRFRNDGGKAYLRAELHLLYRTPGRDGTRVTFGWKDSAGEREASHVFAAQGAPAWNVETGTGVETRWVEYAPVPAR